MTSFREMPQAEQRTPATPITIDIQKIRREVAAVCGKRIAILRKKLPAAPSRLKLERDIQWVEEVRCKWLETDWLERKIIYGISPTYTAMRIFAEANERIEYLKTIQQGK